MSRRNLAVFILAILLASSALSAAEVQLTAVTLQAGKPVDINFSRTSRAPSQAAMQATLLYDNGRAAVKLSFEKMEPAVLFAGDISAYVLWAVTLDGSAENLGEVIADKKSASGSLQGYTGKKVFALMVTAEPFATVTRPTELVIFVSSEIRGTNVQKTPFSFTNFSTGYQPALDSISGIQYNDDTPVAVKQANKAIEIAKKLDAAAVNPKAMDGATVAFGKAMAAAGNKKVMADQARVAAQLASQAIKDTLKANEAKVAAEREAIMAEAKRLAEKAVLEPGATTAEGESQRIAQELKEVQAQREALAGETKNLTLLTEKLTAEKEKDAIAADRDAVKAEQDKVAAEKERNELAGMLKGALSSVAETTETARGVIVSLSGLFDVGKATLKPASQLSVAKLAGILMVFPNMSLSIESYTDSTGTNELNMRLSTARARSVYEFLMVQGISNSQMKYQGFGPDNPVAPNDTETNRAKNRRVEVVVTRAVKAP